MTENKKSIEDLTPPEEFHKIINDFTSDISTTFPEYSGLISRWWNRPSEDIEESKRFALIAVDEIYSNNTDESRNDYWIEVKQEIENI